MAEGLIFRDGSGGYVKLEYSTEVPPLAAAAWNEVAEVRSISSNPGTPDEFDLTHFGSTTKERKTGFSDPGTKDFVCNWVPVAAESHAALMALAASGQERHWRITWPKVHAAAASGAIEVWYGSVTCSPDPGDTSGTPASLNGTVTVGGGYTFTPEPAAA